MDQPERDPKQLADNVVAELAELAFANMHDFARFNPDGSIDIFDWEKARQVGAQVSVKVRKVGRGENARESRRVSVKLPQKWPALRKLADHMLDKPRHRAGRKS